MILYKQTFESPEFMKGNFDNIELQISEDSYVEVICSYRFKIKQTKNRKTSYPTYKKNIKFLFYVVKWSNQITAAVFARRFCRFLNNFCCIQSNTVIWYSLEIRTLPRTFNETITINQFMIDVPGLLSTSSDSLTPNTVAQFEIQPIGGEANRRNRNLVFNLFGVPNNLSNLNYLENRAQSFCEEGLQPYSNDLERPVLDSQKLQTSFEQLKVQDNTLRSDDVDELGKVIQPGDKEPVLSVEPNEEDLLPDMADEDVRRVIKDMETKTSSVEGDDVMEVKEMSETEKKTQSPFPTIKYVIDLIERFFYSEVKITDKNIIRYVPKPKTNNAQEKAGVSTYTLTARYRGLKVLKIRKKKREIVTSKLKK